MWQRIGHLVQQPNGFKAFIPLPFPPASLPPLPSHLEIKHGQAMHLIGKLDGISQLLPDKNFFLFMFVRKEAASSTQIEGTQATMADAIEAKILPKSAHAPDVDDILHYIRALNYGIQRFKTLPFSVRFIRELHEQLMKNARSTQHPFPGEFRYTKNWIGGTNPSNASFVPPPPAEVSRSLGDLEKFIHAKEDGLPTLIKAALLHAQFETIHPFTDGNGRTGRLLVTLFLWKEKLLELPLLYLSDFFKKHQTLYYERLQGYHSDPAQIELWLDFFLEGVIATSHSAIQIASKIVSIREKDMAKLHKLGKTSASTAVDILRNLFKQPIVDVSLIQEWTNMKTRAGAQKVIDRFIDMGILIQRDPDKTYGRTYEYRSYLQLFEKA
ncbi:MAG: Fic family protein [Verrucomicrobiota bacterium]|nr:Fic family protein [Verrucomicrobiota bacterium]